MQRPATLNNGAPQELDLDQYLDAFLSNIQQPDGRMNMGGGGGTLRANGLMSANLVSTPNFPMQSLPNTHPLGYPSTLGYIPGSNPLQFGLFNSQTAPMAFQAGPSMSLPQPQQAAQLQAHAAQLVAQQHAAAQQQQQQQQRQQHQQQMQSAPSAKNARKGKANTRAPRKSEPEPSSGEMDDSSGGGSGSSDEAGQNKSRKKRELTTDEQERRHNALQEKNRRAQRRFRERQKTKLSDLHKQIEDLTGKVGTLQTENSALHSRTSILEKVLDMRNEQIQVMQETKEQNYGYPGNEDEASALQGVGGHLVQLTPEIVKELSSDQVYKIYQTYVQELSVRLAESDKTGPEGEPQARQVELEQLVKDLSMMIMRLGVIKPLETRKFIVVSRQYLGNTESEVIELWKNVMRSIDLGEPQKREVVELKRLFLQKIEPIMEERKHLNVQIQSNLPHDTFHTKNALTYIKAHEAVIKLRDNLRAEQHVVLEFAIAVFRGVFKPREMAKLLVNCYPAVPDALGIASALAAELGEPESPHARQIAMQLGGYTLQGNGVGGTPTDPMASLAMGTGALSGGGGAQMGGLLGGTGSSSNPGGSANTSAGGGGLPGLSSWMPRPPLGGLLGTGAGLLSQGQQPALGLPGHMLTGVSGSGVYSAATPQSH